MSHGGVSLIERDSPWGSLPVADAHIHFFSHRFFVALAAQKPGLTLDAMGAQLHWQMPPAEPEKLADVWTLELDRHGVARAALIASVPGDEESVAAAVRAHPQRFFAYAMLNPREWRAENYAHAGAISAACLFPAMHGYSIQDDCVLSRL